MNYPAGNGGWGAPPPPQQGYGAPQQGWGAQPSPPPQQSGALPSADEFMSGGVKSASFGKAGHSIRGGEIAAPIGYGGEIVNDPFMQQQRDMDTGLLDFWPADKGGGPKLQMVVHLRTDQRDPTDPNDDGTRALYVKAQMAQAVREAVRNAGESGAPKKGGKLLVEYFDDDLTRKQPNKAAPKLFRAKYTPPDPFVGTGAGADPWATNNPPPPDPQQGWGAPPPPAQQQYQAPPPQAAPAQQAPPQQGPPPGAVPDETLALMPAEAVLIMAQQGKLSPSQIEAMRAAGKLQ